MRVTVLTLLFYVSWVSGQAAPKSINPGVGELCTGYNNSPCQDGLICEDPNKPGTDVNSCAEGHCFCRTAPTGHDGSYASGHDGSYASGSDGSYASGSDGSYGGSLASWSGTEAGVGALPNSRMGSGTVETFDVEQEVGTAVAGGLCTQHNLQLDIVSKQICEDSVSVCEVYVKKGTLNGVNVVNGDDYCRAIGLECLEQYDDHNSCTRGSRYSSCSESGGVTSDHIVRCGPSAPPTCNGHVLQTYALWDGNTICAIDAKTKKVFCKGIGVFRKNPPTDRMVNMDNAGSIWVGLTESGELRTWGAHSDQSSLDPVLNNVPAGTNFVDVAVAADHACGIKTDGKLSCWGNAANGRLNAPDVSYKRISLGNGYCIGIKEDDTLHAWGYFHNGAGVEGNVPSGKYIDIDCAHHTCCALSKERTVKCFGWGAETASGTTVTNYFKDARNVEAISVGVGSHCIMMADGEIQCEAWTARYAAPPTTKDLVSMNVQGGTACGLKADNTMVCWGTPPTGSFPENFEFLKSQRCTPPPTWTELNVGGCKDASGSSYNYCQTKAYYLNDMEGCQAVVNSIYQTNIAGMEFQSNNGACIVDMNSQESCENSGFDENDWSCICYNHPGVGAPKAYENGEANYKCYVNHDRCAKMTADVTQININYNVGDSIKGQYDSTGNYCIFSAKDGGTLKNVLLDPETCLAIDEGYMGVENKETLTDPSTWTRQHTPGFYYLKNLSGCECQKTWAEFALPDTDFDSCSVEERIFNGYLDDLELCKTEAENLGGEYIFWHDTTAYCHIYTSCNEFRTANTPGTNYAYICQTTGTPEYPACAEDITNPVADECLCGTMTSSCAAGKYCWNNACTTDAVCHPRTNAQRKAFFGAKLHGTWNSNQRQMSMYLPAPYDITITSITWKNAQDTNALKYTSADHGLWTIERAADPCVPQYTLDVPEATFFGQGSRFTLTGKQMDTKLQIVGTEQVSQTIDGYTYSYEHKIKNEVHLDVELVQQVTISASFTTRYTPSQASNTIKIECDFDTLNGESESFLQECSALYAGVTCESIASGSPGTTITFTGDEDSVLTAALKALYAKGVYQTPSFGPCVILVPHTEFVFVLDSENEDLENGDLQVKMLLQVHSRSCIDHSNGDGVVVDAESTQYLKANSVATFTWVMDENDSTAVAHSFTNNLCVETLWWTFLPRNYETATYNMALDWSLRNGLDNFVTNAEIDIERADVLATIGFTSDVTLYTDAACTQSATSFTLGDAFYAKISLNDMVVNAQSITCDTMTIEQTGLDGTESVTDMKGDDLYNFVQTTSGTNTIICGAELEATHFHVSVDGYHTDLKMDITVNYVQGAQLDSTRRMLSIPLATEEREPDKKSVVVPFEIKSPAEAEVGGLQALMEDKLFYGRRFALLSIIVGVAYVAHGLATGRGGKSDEYNSLL